MKFLKEFLNFFTVITTAITAVVGIVTAFGGYTEVSPYIALQILGSGAVTAVLTAAIYSAEFKSKTHFFLLTAIHYVLLCITMNIIGIMFDWIEASAIGCLMMCIYVAVVYVIVYAISYVLMKKEADALNRALNERNKNADGSR